jgi:hypothetical protein
MGQGARLRRGPAPRAGASGGGIWAKKKAAR